MDEWEEAYGGRWILVDLTNTGDDGDWLDGAVIYGPFETYQEASDWGNANCSLSVVSVLEHSTWETDE